MKVTAGSPATNEEGICMNIIVLAGGTSTERAVSIVSGTQVTKALRSIGHCAVLLDVFAGDGRIEEGLSDEEILLGLQKKGGLLGISGVSNDLRYVIEAAQGGNERAQLAVDVFVTGIVHYIGSFAMDLGSLDYLVFTAGIGEHSAYIREHVCEKLGILGIKLDIEKNERNEAEISAEDSSVKVLVIPTNEELGIARRTYEYQ